MNRYIVISALLTVLSTEGNAAADIGNKALDSINNKILNESLIEDKIKLDKEFYKELPKEVVGEINRSLNRIDAVAETTVNPLKQDVAVTEIKNTIGQTVYVEVEVEAGWRAIDREWLITANSDEVRLLETLGAEIKEHQRLDNLELLVVRFKIPRNQNEKDIIGQLPERLKRQLGRNHVYEASQSHSNEDGKAQGNEILYSVCNKPIKVGMIDTAINTDHPTFKAVDIKQKQFTKEAVKTPTAHGTAVASLLAGKDQLTPLLSQTTLYAASVFYPRNNYSQGAPLINLIKALDWLAGENVEVINMSLTGPVNPILEAAINQALKQDITIVAAAGNEGPAASPRFPAAYKKVVAVTAVDNNDEIYRWANQGEYIDFSALGVLVKTARVSNGSGYEYGLESGTSIATPVVTAKVACQIIKDKTKKNIISNLELEAIDLGDPGRDPVYGYGKLE